MMKFGFRTTRSILVEPGVASRIGGEVGTLLGRSVLVVTDRGIREAGLVDGALASLRDAGLKVDIYDGVQADPPESVVVEAAERARHAEADGIVGIGGGSSLDVAKLVAVLARSDRPLGALYGIDNVTGGRLPLVLVPTTAGTGSEVTPISIITTGVGEKKGVVSPVLLPDAAVLDAELTVGLPVPVTAATGVDAMVHAIEAYTSVRLKNPLSDLFAREALALLSGHIRTVCTDGSDVEARQQMLLGSTYAGIAFANAPVAAVHALAYPVGALFHVPHGLSNSLVLPHVLKFNAGAAQRLYAELADIVAPEVRGDVRSRVDAFIAYFESLPEALGLPTTLSGVGIAAADLPKLASDAMLQTRLLVNNPREVTHDDALAIYEAAL